MFEPIVSKWLKQTFCKHWRRITLIVVFSCLLAFARAAFPAAWQLLIDRAIEGKVDYSLVALLAILFLVRIVPVVEFLRGRFLNRYDFDVRFQLFKHVLRLSVPFHKEKESTKVMLEANKGVGAAVSLLNILLRGEAVADIPVAFFAFCYVASYSWVAFVVMTVFLFVFLFLGHVLGCRIEKAEEERNEVDNAMSTREREVVQQIETVKLHCAERQEHDWFRATGGQVFDLDNQLVVYYNCFQLLSRLAQVLPFCIAMAIFVPDVAAGRMTVGTFIALQMYGLAALAPAGFLGEMYQEIKTNVAKLKPALRLFEQQPTIVESRNPLEMEPLRHEINLHNVSFRYPNADEPVLVDVSCRIAAGEKVAVVGKTGSGKTTLARLLVRFYDPDRGLVTMDGVDIRHLSFESLYQQVSYVTQEVPVFSGTVGENIRYGLPDCGDGLLRVACESASAGFALRQNDGLETRVGELGEKLSGGERQRLALARVFLRRPSLLILDEATSALDQMTEREVQQAFDRLLQMNGGTTMVVIAHRITTVRNANRIMVLDKGRIVDQGTHDELLGRCVLYQDLCQGMAS